MIIINSAVYILTKLWRIYIYEPSKIRILNVNYMLGVTLPVMLLNPAARYEQLKILFYGNDEFIHNHSRFPPEGRSPKMALILPWMSEPN